MVSTFREAMRSISVVYAGVIPAVLNIYCLDLLGAYMIIFKLCPCEFRTDGLSTLTGYSFFKMHKYGNVGIKELQRM